VRNFIAGTAAVINHVQLLITLMYYSGFFFQRKVQFSSSNLNFMSLKITMISGDQHFNVDSSPVCLLAGIGDLKDQQSEHLLISRMLANHTVDFLWNTGSDWPGWPAQDNKTTVFNRYCRAGFTSKVWLMRQMFLTFMNINFQFTHNVKR